MRLFKNANYNFLRWRWHAVALSWIVRRIQIKVQIIR